MKNQIGKEVFTIATIILLILFLSVFTLQSKFLIITLWLYISLKCFKEKFRLPRRILVKLFLLGFAFLVLKPAVCRIFMGEENFRHQSIYLKTTNNITESVYPWAIYFTQIAPEEDFIKPMVWSFQLMGATNTPHNAISRDICNLGTFNNPMFKAFKKNTKNLHYEQVIPFQMAKYIGLYPQIKHFYLCLPEKKILEQNSEKGTPLIVFAHGFLGNARAYMDYMKEINPNAIIMCISAENHIGIFTKTDIANIFEKYIPFIEKQTQATHKTQKTIDINKVHLVGLSNGGSAVFSGFESKYANRFKTYTSFVGGLCKKLPENIKEKPIHVYYGDIDSFGPRTKRNIIYNKKKGFNIIEQLFRKEAHFIVYNQKDSIQTSMRTYLK
ncbi:MAG: hypothetical protein WBG43_02230 [Marinifilaceae bacterium]